MRNVTSSLIRLAIGIPDANPYRRMFAAWARVAGILEDKFARAAYLEGLLGFSSGAITGNESTFFSEAREALRSGSPNRIVDTLRYEHGMSEKDVALMVGNRDAGFFDSLLNGVRSNFGTQSFRGLVAEDIVMSIMAGISPITGGPLKYGKGQGVFHWLGTRPASKLTVRGIKSVIYKEARNRAADIIRGTRKEEMNQLDLYGPTSGGGGAGDAPASTQTLNEVLEDPTIGRANYIDLAAAIYSDPWVMQVIDDLVQSNLTTPSQEAVWKVVRQDPSLLTISRKGLGIEASRVAPLVAQMLGNEYMGRSSDVSVAKTFRQRVRPAMSEALADSAIAKRLLRKRHILEVIQEHEKRKPRHRVNLGPIPYAGEEPPMSGEVFEDPDPSGRTDIPFKEKFPGTEWSRSHVFDVDSLEYLQEQGIPLGGLNPKFTDEAKKWLRKRGLRPEQIGRTATAAYIYKLTTMRQRVAFRHWMGQKNVAYSSRN
mgnify:CR=1 FL=1